MGKRILKVFLNIILFLALCLSQVYVFNKWYIFGTRFNAILLFVIVQAMLNQLKISLPISFFAGIVTDILFGYGTIKYILIYMIVALVLESLKMLYKQDKSLSIAIYATAGLIIFEILTALFNFINTGIAINIISYFFAVLKVIALNVPATYLVYIIISRINRIMEK